MLRTAHNLLLFSFVFGSRVFVDCSLSRAASQVYSSTCSLCFYYCCAPHLQSVYLLAAAIYEISDKYTVLEPYLCYRLSG